MAENELAKPERDSRWKLAHVFQPGVVRIKTKLLGYNPIETSAVMVDEIGREVIKDDPPAIYEEASLGRVVGANEFSTLEAEYQRMRGGKRKHPATKVYEIRDVLISSGQAYTKKSMSVLSPTKVPWLHTSSTQELGSASIMSSWVGIKFFGHWLVDDLPSALALEKYAPLYSLRVSPWRDEKAYLARLELSVRRTQSAFVRRLFIIDDIGQNESKGSRSEEVRRRLSASVGPTVNAGVFLVRGNTGAARRLTNESELIRALESHHIKAIDPAKLTPDEIIERCSGAEVVMGVEGSQLSHGLAGSARRAAVLTIQPPDRFNHVYKDRCDCPGKPYGFVVASGNGNEFSVDIDETKRVLDRLLKVRTAF